MKKVVVAIFALKMTNGGRLLQHSVCKCLEMFHFNFHAKTQGVWILLIFKIAPRPLRSLDAKNWKLENLKKAFSTNKINSVSTSEATRGHQRPPEAKTLINSSKDAFLRLQLNSKVDQQPRINRIFDLWGHPRPKIAFRGWCNSWKKTFFRLCWTPKLFSDLEFRKPNYLISDLWGHWRPKPENYYWRHLSRIFNYCARLL